MGSRYDAIVVGGGHNGLVAATLLGRAGLSVLVLERSEHVGGAAVSTAVFEGVDARLSRYAYLVSLFPAALLGELGVGVELRRRPEPAFGPEWSRLREMLARIGGRVLPTLTEPLRSRGQFRELVGDEEAWEGLFERPLSELLERRLSDDVARGVALSDGLIGTFAAADDPGLRQNRCFLYHVVGSPWSIPVGGMGAISAALVDAARDATVTIRTRAEVTEIDPDGEVGCADGSRYGGSQILANVAPAVLARLIGEPPPDPAPEGSQLKLNMLLRRLPRLRDPAVSPEQAFTGTFHVNEGYSQLQRAYAEAAAGRIPATPPCELYCHSLSDPSILSAELRSAGAHALTVFGLQMPARLFADDPDGAKERAVAATLASIDSLLAEPIEDCLAHDADGVPCLEAHTPLDLEADLGMPGGHIFHPSPELAVCRIRGGCRPVGSRDRLSERVAVRRGRPPRGLRQRHPGAQRSVRCAGRAQLTSFPQLPVGEVVRVDLRVVLPLVGQLVLGEAGVNRAGLDASVAVDALLGIDVEHLDAVIVGLVRGGMDAVNRTDLYARVVLRADARLGDDVGHECVSSCSNS